MTVHADNACKIDTTYNFIRPRAIISFRDKLMPKFFPIAFTVGNGKTDVLSCFIFD